MSDRHLAAGSVEPPRVQGLLRVYSMKYCPFAQRARLVVKAKNLPHDIVNIDLNKKPEWYFQIHPKGQVPALVDGDNTVIESLDIADYLDEKYPGQNPLYPSDPVAKENDKKIITLIGAATDAYYKFLNNPKDYTVEEAMSVLLPPLEPLEKELKKRETTYFGGAKPGMIDFMLWPWAERSGTIAPRLGVKEVPFRDDQIPTLRKWSKAMLLDPTARELVIPLEEHIRYREAKKNQTPIDEI